MRSSKVNLNLEEPSKFLKFPKLKIKVILSKIRKIGFWYLEMDFKNFKMQVLIKVLRFLQASYLKFIRMRLVLSQDKALIINLRNLKVIQLLNNWSFWSGVMS